MYHGDFPKGVAWKIDKIKLFTYIVKPVELFVLIPKYEKISLKSVYWQELVKIN